MKNLQTFTQWANKINESENLEESRVSPEDNITFYEEEIKDLKSDIKLLKKMKSANLNSITGDALANGLDILKKLEKELKELK